MIFSYRVSIDTGL